MEPAWRRYKKVRRFSPCTLHQPLRAEAGVLTLPPWAPVHCAADLLSALDFDESGDYLATGDRGGRIVVFERGAADQARRGRVLGPRG